MQAHLNARSWATLEKAREHCEKLLADVRTVCDEYFESEGLDHTAVCCVVVGSVGRGEALDASDIDFSPVLRDQDALTVFRIHDQLLRETLRQKLRLKVSKGEQLTSATSLDELTDAESIGGASDGSVPLTKRILILTEGKQAGGQFDIKLVRERLMRAYADHERTRGRHVLSLCNDIARYYRTLCIEYKAKVDADPDWCNRNVKLRHSRKFWYFSCVCAVAAVAESNPQGDHAYIGELLEAFHKSPAQRLFDAVGSDRRGLVGRIVEPYSWFLEFMAKEAHRKGLAGVNYDDRYAVSIDNPFPVLKFCSDRLHQEIMNLIDSLPVSQRHRMLSWFLL